MGNEGLLAKGVLGKCEVPGISPSIVKPQVPPSQFSSPFFLKSMLTSLKRLG